MKQVKIKLLPGGKMPTKATKGAAAWDCYAREDVKVSGEATLIGLGFMAEPPEGYYLEIVPRSSIGLKTPLRQPNSVGIIDPDYRGEVKAMYECKVRPIQQPLLEMRDVDVLPAALLAKEQQYIIKAGDRIAQMILRKIHKAELVEVVSLSDTERGEGGFGSTGK